jgi:hypothetical protein
VLRAEAAAQATEPRSDTKCWKQRSALARRHLPPEIAKKEEAEELRAGVSDDDYDD